MAPGHSIHCGAQAERKRWHFTRKAVMAPEVIVFAHESGTPLVGYMELSTVPIGNRCPGVSQPVGHT